MVEGASLAAAFAGRAENLARKAINMYYVYILKSLKDHNLYIGSTKDLKQRFIEHNSGKVISTKHRVPLDIVIFEAYKNKKIAQRREKYLKSSDGHKDIHKRLE